MILNRNTNLYFNIQLNEIAELTETSKLVYSALYTSAYITNSNVISNGGRNLTAFALVQKDLAKCLKMDKKSVTKAIQQLIELNLITTYLSDDKLTAFYKINNPTDRTEITEFNKYTSEFCDVIIIPAEIIQLSETASIRLAIGQLQFVWTKKDDRSQQYYDLCNLTQAEKILHRNFRKTFRTIKAKGYISYDLARKGSFQGFVNIKFNIPVNAESEEKEKEIKIIKHVGKANELAQANEPADELAEASQQANGGRILSFLNDEPIEADEPGKINIKSETYTNTEKEAVVSADTEAENNTNTETYANTEINAIARAETENNPGNETDTETDTGTKAELSFSEYKKLIEQEKEETRRRRAEEEAKEETRRTRTEEEIEALLAFAV